MNAPDRFALFNLAEGEKKLEVLEDTKIPNAATITIKKEDHTVANMLRAQLLERPTTLFCGYRVPHPLEPQVVIKLQTDGTETPIQSVQEACHDLIKIMHAMKKQLQGELLKAKARGEEDEIINGGIGMEGLEGTGGGGGYGYGY